MPLSPPGWRTTEFIHRIGIRADQPNPDTVTIGTLYFVTDEFVIERSTGVVWEAFSGIGVIPDPLFVSTVIGGTGANDDLHLRATSGVGTVNARVFIEVGTNGAIQAIEVKPDAGGNFGQLGIGTPGNVTLDGPLVVFGTGSDVGILIKAKAAGGAPNAYLQLLTGGSDANAEAGASFFQSNNQVEWRLSLIGNDADALRYTSITGGGALTTHVMWLVKDTGNIILDSVRNDHNGSKSLILGDGTAPTALASNTAALYANDVGGTVQLFGINEAGRITRITDPVVEQTTTSTGTQNDFDLNGRNVHLRCNNASLLTLTGFTVLGATPFDGDRVTISSVNAQVNLAYQTGSTAANQLLNWVTSGVTPMLLGSASYIYDGATDRWRLVAHEQGSWITPSFSAGDYTANNAMTWTVASGDVNTNKYRLSGKTLQYAFDIRTTTVGGTPSTQLRFTLPNGWTIVAGTHRAINRVSDNGTPAFSMMDATGTNAFIQFFAGLAAGNWTASTDNTFIVGEITFEVA